MVKLIGLDTMLHISFSLAAFVFSVVLYILVCALGTGQIHKNLKFRTLTVTIVIGNLISMLDNIFRDSGVFPTPLPVQLLLLLLVYQANILLTYYMALYMEGFFHDFKLKRFFFRLNTGIVISSILFTGAVYFARLILYSGPELVEGVAIWIRVVLGYAYELYFLIYNITLFIIFGRNISVRARSTSLAAFIVAIGSVLLELVNTFDIGSGILYNYFGAVIALYIFYIGVETPDYQNLLHSLTALDQARKTADEANRSKSDFLANMSHEIRTPINTVLGMNEMILREAEDEVIRTYSENIRVAGGTLLGLINDILDFSKIEAGKIEIIPADYDLSSLISDTVNMIRSRADEKGLLLILDFDKNLPGKLRGDAMRIKQILTNILTNAVKYTKEGSITFRIGFEWPEPEKDSVILKASVRDTGIGIRPEDMPKLFLEFERIEEKRNRNVEGTGLGLSITRSLLHLMGSELQVESTYGEGSVFSFDLKQEVVSREALGDYEAACKAPLDRRKYRVKFTAPEARVLVVDDNRMNLMVFRSLMKQTKILVDTAERGEEGIALCEQNRYDLIFLDHMMPGLDGIETLHLLREKIKNGNARVPAVCLTANAISGARETYIQKGFEDYLSKPIDSTDLERILLSYLPKELIREAEEEESMPAEEGKTGIPEELYPLGEAGVDLKDAIKSSGGLENYMDLLKVYYETIDANASQLQSFFESRDYDGYTVLVHSLKSSSRIIGAAGLGEEAQKLEDAGKARDEAWLIDHHEAFLQEYRKLKLPLSAIFRQETVLDEKPAASAELMADAYRRIRTAAEEMDYDALEAVFDEMSAYAVPQGEEKLWEELHAAFEQFEYPGILDLLSKD
ncbi:MAG: response regulator [Lachnospiraceae bacterium]|nr:response regulator [Lachnospiraceae bacterium]